MWSSVAIRHLTNLTDTFAVSVKSVRSAVVHRVSFPCSLADPSRLIIANVYNLVNVVWRMTTPENSHYLSTWLRGFP